MRVKTSVTLPEELLREIDQVDSNRSGFLEKAALQYLAKLSRIRREENDAEIYEKNMQYLNEEAMDVLEYQYLPE